jgi:hypothetical protein
MFNEWEWGIERINETNLPGTTNVQIILNTLRKARHEWSKSNRKGSPGTPIEAITIPIDTSVSV